MNIKWTQKLGDHTSSKVKTTSDLYPLFKQSGLQIKHFLKPVPKFFQDPFSNNSPQHISASAGWSGVFGRQMQPSFATLSALLMFHGIEI